MYSPGKVREQESVFILALPIAKAFQVELLAVNLFRANPPALVGERDLVRYPLGGRSARREKEAS